MMKKCKNGTEKIGIQMSILNGQLDYAVEVF
mgnify:FL=1